MKFDSYIQNKTVKDSIYCKKSIFISTFHGNDDGIIEFIRFEEKKDHFVWVHANEICFVKSADHYIKALIQCGGYFKWMTRHSTIKELLEGLIGENFIRLNKFYLLNLDYFSHINETGISIFLKDDVSIPVNHRISPYMLHSLKSTLM